MVLTKHRLSTHRGGFTILRKAYSKPNYFSILCTMGKPDMWEGGPELQEIEQNVYITNFFGAKNKKKLIEKGITHVLVCAHELPEVFPNDFTYKKYDFHDNTNFPISDYFEDGLSWIKAAVDAGGKVLLHCASGSSRSGTIATAYVMEHRKCTLSEALKRTQTIRKLILPNPGFCEQLHALETKLAINDKL